MSDEGPHSGMTASSGLDPETITTTEDLDALPVGSVVLIGDELTIEKRQHGRWQAVGQVLPIEHATVVKYAHTAVVLHRPDRPSEATRLRSGIEALADECERAAADHYGQSERAIDVEVISAQGAIASAYNRVAKQARALLAGAQ